MTAYLDGFWSTGFGAWLSFMLDNPESRAVLVSIFFAGIASFIGFVWNLTSKKNDEKKARDQQRREHTIDIVLRMLTTKRLADPFQQVNRWIGSPEAYQENPEFTEEQRKIIHPDNMSDDCAELLLLLGYYEFICQSFLAPEPSLDRDVIIRQRKSAIRDGFAVLAPAIQDRRGAMHRDQQYEHLEVTALYLMAIDFASMGSSKDKNKRDKHKVMMNMDIGEPLTNKHPPIFHSFRTYVWRHCNNLISQEWIDDVKKIAISEDNRLETRKQNITAVNHFFRVLDKHAQTNNKKAL